MLALRILLTTVFSYSVNYSSKTGDSNFVSFKLKMKARYTCSSPLLDAVSQREVEHADSRGEYATEISPLM